MAELVLLSVDREEIKRLYQAVQQGALFANRGRAEMDLVPDTRQLAQVMSQATPPAFVLGAPSLFYGA